jgi:hypothetical protein
MPKREYAMLQQFAGGRTIRSEVRVMARAEGWALVRHKACLPFVVRERELEPSPRATPSPQTAPKEK